MSQQNMKLYSVEFKERAIKLAVESDQPIAQTARDLGINENTLHTWISKYHQGRTAPRAASTLRTSMRTSND
jgi:transposase